MDKKIVFVILHYNAIQETENCVESIEKKIDTKNYHIVIIDNASPNYSGRELKRKFCDKDNVTVILNKENLGFARGNNIGYRYAVNVLKADFICIMNNDTLIEQNDFFEVICDEYKKSNYGIMGPKIYLNEGRVNPVYVKLPGVDFFEDLLKKKKKEYKQMKLHLNYILVPCKLLRNQIYKILKIERKSRFDGILSLECVNQRKEDVVLHGCCIVFSPNYCGKYKEGFDPRTFLYKEEELLYLRCKKKNMKIVYNPKLTIRHLEDVSTNSMKYTRRKKIMFWLKNQIDSLEILVDELKQEEKNGIGNNSCL